MKRFLYNVLQSLDLYDYVKIFKDKFFKSKQKKIEEIKRFNFYSQFVKKEDLCFDIGANYGNRSEIFLKLGAKVIAVEPQPLPYKFLKRKFKNKITIDSRALGSENGNAKMFISSASTLTSLSTEWIDKVKENRFKEATWNNQIEVEVTTMDNLIDQYGKPDFCKIDVEGYEFEVLKGLSKSIKYISFEFTFPEFVDKAINCIEHLNQLGKMVCNYSEGEKMELGLNEWVSPNIFIDSLNKFSDRGIIDGDIYVKYLIA